jgi:xylulokinase
MQTEQGKPTSQYVLAIDLGSGGPKVGLVDRDGQVIACARRSTPIYFLPGGGVEQDTADWWQAVSAAVREVLKTARISSESILAVAVTGQWSVTVAVDENGEALMNAISWMDHRGGIYNKVIVKGFPSIQGYGLAKLIQFVRSSGIPPTLTGSDIIGHIAFIQNERPEVYKKTYKFLDTIDFINFRLTGKCAATKNTLFPYGLTDNRKLDLLEYDPTLLKLTGVDRSKLPDILPVDGTVGSLKPTIASELGLSPQTIVISGANDNSVAPIGAGAILDYESAAVMGTSGMLCFHVPFKKTDVMHTVATMPSALPGRYLFWSDLGNNGKVLDSYLSNLILWTDELGPGELNQEVYEKMNRAAAGVQPGCDGLLFLPWFNGSLSPAEDPSMRGGFLNISNRTTRNHLTRAVLEGLSYNWRWLKEVAEGFNGRKFPHWKITGGGAVSEVWAQIMADVVGIPIHQQADPFNNTVLGIAFLAFNRLGMMPLDEIPGKVKIAKVFEPREKYRPVYDKLYKQFSAAYKNNKPIFHALNK